MPFNLLSKLVLFKPKCLGATVKINAFLNDAMDTTKTVKTLNLAKKRILPNLVMKRILPKKRQST